MDLEKHFDILNKYGDKNLDLDKDLDKSNCLKKTCCEKEENHIIINDVIECKECRGVVTNIVSNAEWKYYGSNNLNSSPAPKPVCEMSTSNPATSV